MANQTTIGELSINLQLKLEGLEKGLETARTKLQQLENENKKIQSSNNQLDASFIAMSASIVASLVKIKSAVDDGVQKYNSYVNSMSALQKTAKATNNSMTDIKDAIEDVNELKLMDDSDVTAATKNLLTYGFTVDQTKDMLLVLQDAAVGNRQANYSLSEAVRVTTEGIRMENSVLSDAAGVQKNISKMYEEYAKSLGKTTDSLSQAEKAQAVYNGIMNEAAMFTGSAAEMANGYQGIQAQVNATNLELSRTIGESMIPALTKCSSLQLSITKGLTEFASNHKGITSGIIIFTTTLLAATLALIGLKKAKDAYTSSALKATIATKGFTAALMANPIFAIATVIATAVAGISMLCSAIRENEEAQAKLNETTERYKQIKAGVYEYTDSNIQKMEDEKSQIQQRIDLLNQRIELEKKIKQIEDNESEGEFLGAKTYKGDSFERLEQYRHELAKNEKAFAQLQKANSGYGNSLDEFNKRLEETNEWLSKTAVQKNITNLLDTESVKSKKREAAQAVETAKSYRELYQTYLEGKKGTKDYEEAVTELEKKFPEAVNANGIMAEDMKILIEDMARNAGIAWENTQTTIQERIDNITEAIKNCNPELDPNGTYAKSLAEKIGVPTNEVIGTLQTALNLYDMLLNKDSEEVGKSTYTPKSTKASGGSKSYSNKRLDNYKKEIEHKKAMDQLSLQQEIAMYQTALKKYAKTQDEKRELQEKIYSLQKEFQEKEYSNYVAFVEHKKALDKKSVEEEINDYTWAYYHLAETTEQKRELEEKLYELHKELAQKEKSLLEQKTTDYERYIQDQKNLRGAEYDAKEQESDLNKIIALHKSYLNQIMKDERLSLDERKELYQEELDTIRDYEQQKRDLRVEAVNSTVSQLTSAITKQIEELEEADKKAIEENIKIVEQWKDTRIKAINEEYDARITAIQKELDLLDKSEEEKSRAEEDAEYERKRNRLQQLVDFEHDATTKANYQKELDKLIAEYQKTLDSRALQDKKDALNAQKDLLQEEKDNKVQAVEDEAEKQKEVYDKQLDDLEEYYEKQKEMAQETAEKMLLNVEQNQNQILKLLGSYGDAYELTGQSLGEKLAQGINNGIADKIQNMIQKVQDTIDANIERKIKEWSASNYNYETSANNKPQAKTVNVYQTNNIQQNPEMPSETYRKLNNVSQSLAAELAGM